MKKSLVLAMAMAMGVTASAYAANPFSDVAAGHWAYDSINKLVAAGVIDGYGATFGGEKLMTRYEMAQIVAKAMAKGANVDKLVAEFADELDALGVRVAKLEKKADNVKITGQIRFDYKNHAGKGHDGAVASNGAQAYSTMRTRLFVNGQINDNWSYTGMLQNHRSFCDNDGNIDDVKLPRAYIEGRLGAVKVLAGHWNEFFVNDTILDEFVDGLYAETGFAKGKAKVYGIAGKANNVGSNYTFYGSGPSYTPSVTKTANNDKARLYVFGVSGKASLFDLALNWFRTEHGVNPFGSEYYPGDDPSDVVYSYPGYDGGRNIYNLNVAFNFMKDFRADLRYMWTDDRVAYDKDGKGLGSKDGFFAQLDYKGADTAKAGTWGLRARWFDQPRNVWLAPTYDCNVFGNNGGYDGWGFGGDYVFAKNVMLSTDYYDTKAKDSKGSDRVWYSQLWFMF